VRVIRDVFTGTRKVGSMQPGRDALLFSIHFLQVCFFGPGPSAAAGILNRRLFEVSRFVTAPSPGSRHFAQGTDYPINLFW
jgi:hypothetical protein